MQLSPVIALEVGTTKVVAVVGELREKGRLVIAGMGEQESKGVRQGEVIDVENAVACVRSALLAAEESAQVTICEVLLAVSGGHIQSQTNRGIVRIAGHDGEISTEDIERVKDSARAIHLPRDREILHTIWQHVCIDGQRTVVNPEGLVGGQLSLDMLAVHGLRTRLENTIQAVQNVPMEVDDVVFSGLCSALAVLTPAQKEIGVLMIDLGGGTTDYVAYTGKVLMTAGSLSIGGDHNASVEETLAIVRSRVESMGLLRQFGVGVVLTGGGARLRGIAQLAEGIFELPCQVGVPREVDGPAAVLEGPQYATAVGLARYGFRAQACEPPLP